jgi:hypothetical protein
MGFETDITIKRGLVSAQVKGITPTIHLAFDTDGLTVNTKKVRVNISEKSLIDLSYPVRNAKNEVFMMGDLVSFADSTGLVKTYSVAENWPDESLGTIVLILEKYVAV